MRNRTARHGRLEDLPRHEGHGGRYRDRALNENLKPLMRFLMQHVGQPWNKVRSEIARALSVHSAVQKHVLDHVKGWIIDNVHERDGELWGGTPVAPLAYWALYRSLRMFWICPKTGHLRLLEPSIGKSPYPGHKIGESVYIARIKGTWTIVETALVPVFSNRRISTGCALSRFSTASHAYRAWRAMHEPPWPTSEYVVRYRAASKREIRSALA